MQSQKETVFSPLEYGQINPLTDSAPSEIISGNNHLLRFEDGSALLGDLSQPAPAAHRPINANDFLQNLADGVLEEQEIRQIGYDLKKSVEEDIKSQANYFEAVRDCLKLLGLDINSSLDKEDLPFVGATTVNSTSMFDTLQDISATASTSLFPPTGMVDCVIQGEANDELRDRAYRKKTFFNYYLTQIAKEFKKEGRRAINWAILTGSCYKKVFIDPALGRPTSSYIRPEDFIVNRDYATHITAARKTHIIHLTKRELQIRTLMGRYRDIDVMDQENPREDNDDIQIQLDEMSGYTSDGSDFDESYSLLEVHCDYEIKGDPLRPKGPDGEPLDISLPYIITIDKKSGNVLDIIRNWEPNDVLRKKKEYFVNYSLLTSFDGEGYGLVHYASRLSKAATAITRQIINTATYANFPGGIYAAGIRMENNNLRTAPGEFVPVQTGGLPINQVISPLPYKEPGPVLQQLLDRLENNIKKPSAIINEDMINATTRAPMGSVLWMFESLQKVPNAILESFHESFGQELMLFNERFAEWMQEGTPYPFRVPGGEHVIMKQDFMDEVLVVPASNPALQNSSYRFMQAELILNNARQGESIHNMRYAYEYFYKNMGLSPEDIEQLLPPTQATPVPFSGDPITENQKLMTNKPVMANVQQDHHAHMMVHGMILSNPNTPPEVMAATKAHTQEHEALQFLVEMQANIGFEMPQDPSQIPPEIQNQIAVAAAQVAQSKAQEQQAGSPPALMDPALAEVEVEKIRVEQRRESDVMKYDTERMRLEFEQQKLNAEMQMEQLKIERQREADAVKAELENKKIELDHVTKENAHLLEQVQHLQSTNPSTQIHQGE